MVQIDNAVLPKGSLILVTVSLHPSFPLFLYELTALVGCTGRQRYASSLLLVKLIETDLTRNFAGFVASHVIDQLLELGYKVRGAARSQAKLEEYQKRWDDKFPQQFEFVEVPDILKSGAYDEAIKGKLDSTVSAF